MTRVRLCFKHSLILFYKKELIRILKYKKPILSIAFILGIILLLNYFNVFDYITIENLKNLKEFINGFGILGPIIYIVLYIGVCLFFLPAIPIALLAGFAFGPIKGTIMASLGSTIGCALAFLVARYALRDMVEGWAKKSDYFKKIDQGVKTQGFRIIIITRLVPIFPFNLQNFLYGLTDINFFTYVILSWICMLPATAVFTFSAGAISSGESLGKIFIYLAIASIFFVILSFIPSYIKKKMNVD